VVAEASGYQDGRWNLGDPAWTAHVGRGCSSPIVFGDKLYVTGWQQDSEIVRCLDLETGRPLWRQEDACPQYGRVSTGDKGIYGGPSSTPTLDSETGLLYTLSIDGDLRCWDTRSSGRAVWSWNLYDRYEVGRRPNVGSSRRMHRDYGYSSSPLIHDGQLIVEVGAEAGNLIALDKRTGKPQWVSQCKDEAGHSGGPVPMTIEGVPCAAILTLRNLVVVRLDEEQAGETVAEHPWTTDFANNIATPAVDGQSVIVTSAYNRYAMCRLDVSLRGAEKVWEVKNCSGVCSPVIRQGHVYWAWRGVHCVEFATGKELWSGGNVGSAGSCLMTADDRLVVWANQGDLLLVDSARRSPQAFRELAGRRKLFRADAWPHVVLSNGRLLVKDRQGNLACFRLP